MGRRAPGWTWSKVGAVHETRLACSGEIRSYRFATTSRRGAWPPPAA